MFFKNLPSEEFIIADTCAVDMNLEYIFGICISFYLHYNDLVQFGGCKL